MSRTQKSLARLALAIPLVFAVSGCTTGTIGAACGSNPLPPPPGDSLRVATFNAALFSPIFQCGGPPLPTPGGPHHNLDCHIFNDLGGSTSERANLIADELVRGDFDVVLLNEVWDEDDGKDVLVDRLCERYPFFVEYVDTLTAGAEEDSGLMLFSTLPFEALPDDAFVSLDNTTSNGDDDPRVAFVKFDDCAEPLEDCLAAKGAVLVTVRLPASNRRVHLVATHMQANTSGEVHDNVRVTQLRQALGDCDAESPTGEPSLVETTLGPGLAGGETLCAWTNRQWVVFAGDLNIPGEGAVGDSLHPADAPSSGLAEWFNRIGLRTARAGSTGFAMYDAWAETTSELDAGVTRLGVDSDGNRIERRLDHVWVTRRTPPTGASPPTAPASGDLCVQHMTIPPDLVGLSDHRAVGADLNLGAAQCNPRLAQTLGPDDMGALDLVPGKEARRLHRTLQRPGSMQWWRIDEPGTFLIALEPAAAAAGVRFEVLHGGNLSSPLGGAHDLGVDTLAACDYLAAGTRCDDTEGRKMVWPEGPHFVRVFNPDRTWTGPYWIAFYHYTCKTRDDACELLPQSPVRFRFPPGEALNAVDDGAWFHLAIEEQADSGERQTLRFFARRHAAASAWNAPSVSLLAADGVTPVAVLDGDPLASIPPVEDLVGLEGATRSDAELFLRVFRSDVAQDVDVDVGWHTDLVLLGGQAIGPDPAVLRCKDETNPEWGHDEIRLTVDADGQGFAVHGHALFDCNNTETPRRWEAELGVVRFVSDARLVLVEGDVSGDDHSAAHTVEVPADRDMAAPEARAARFEWSGGEYVLHFNVGKWRRE